MMQRLINRLRATNCDADVLAWLADFPTFADAWQAARVYEMRHILRALGYDAQAKECYEAFLETQKQIRKAHQQGYFTAMRQHNGKPTDKTLAAIHLAWDEADTQAIAAFHESLRDLVDVTRIEALIADSAAFKVTA